MLQPIKLFSTLAPKNIEAKQNNNQNFHVNFATKPDTFERTAPKQNILAPAYIPFTGYKNDEAIRSLGNIICPCCGVPMMTNKDMNRVSKGLGCTSEQAINTLNNYEKYMHPVEKECFNLLKTWSKENPKSNFKELLKAHKDEHLELLQVKQNKILDSVDEISKNLTETEQEEVKKVTDLTRKMVSTYDKDIKFKRKTFIKDIEDLAGKISNKEIHKQMVKEAEKMPNSKNDVSSFIVKYGSGRGHKEIGERLVSLSVGTIEHIHPQSKGGKNRVDNYLLECGECNHTRSSIPLGEWVDDHPEMIENTQKYIDEVIKHINNGGMKGFEFYPEAVARTLYHESDGKIDVKVEGLKTDEEDC